MSKSRELEEYRKRAEGIIDRQQNQIANQREAISRLVVAVPLRDVPEGGVKVRFRLSDTVPAAYPVTIRGDIEYLVIEESTVDDDGGITVVLKPED